MNVKQCILATSIITLTHIAFAEPAPKSIDLNKLYGKFEKSGYSTLELMDTTKQVLISGTVLDVSQSFSGSSILKIGAHANSQELARLTAGDDAQENKLKLLKIGSNVKAICDLGFSSGTQYIPFQDCVFK
jgi:hypothetical protein